MESLLVIDDEPSVRHAIKEVMTSDRLGVLVAEDAREAISLFRQHRPLLVLLDLRLRLDSGLNVFAQLRAIDPQALIVFITGHGTSETAIETIKLGAFDYLVKPLDFDQLQQIVEQALKISRLMRAPTAVEADASQVESSDRLVGNGLAMQSLCKQIGRVAPQDVNALVLGESGTGKELVARAIYQHSRRNQAPFLAINCAAIPEALLESELFGHEQGAFTGANRQRIGKFEQCHTGTMFLDEVGDMPPATQAKILRLLQDGQFQRVGGNETLRVNVRIIAATNQSLEEMIEQGRFRRDLFYRLRGVTLHLPPLRERTEDIRELAKYFLLRFNRQLGTAVQSIADETLQKLQTYHWPGNIRELQSVIREALIVSIGPTLLPDFLPIELLAHASRNPLPHIAKTAAATEIAAGEAVGLSASLGEATSIDTDAWSELGASVFQSLKSGHSDAYRHALHGFDRLVITLAMGLAGGLQSKASELLALSRPTLRAKLRALLKEDALRKNLQ